MIWIYNHITESIEKLTLEEFMRRFNAEENFSNTYTIQTIQYEYPHARVWVYPSEGKQQ